MGHLVQVMWRRRPLVVAAPDKERSPVVAIDAWDAQCPWESFSNGKGRGALGIVGIICQRGGNNRTKNRNKIPIPSPLPRLHPLLFLQAEVTTGECNAERKTVVAVRHQMPHASRRSKQCETDRADEKHHLR